MTTPTGPNTPAEPSTPPRRTGLWVGIAIAILVVVGVIIAAVSGAFSGSPAASPSATPEASVSASTEPSATAEPSPSPSVSVPVAATVPTDCRAAFTRDLQAKFERNDIPLNHPGVSVDAVGDDQLLALLGTLEPKLTCDWAAPGDSGAFVSFAAVNDEQATLVVDRMTATGATCTAEEGGTLCVGELQTSDDNPWAGEGAGILDTAFVRDGLWISTHQINLMGKDLVLDAMSAVFAH